MEQPLSILFEDDALLVLDKPSGISVIPERYEGGNASLLELLERLYRPLHPIQKPRPVHRIDKETSGIVLFAKTEEAFRVLSQQFEQHTITKTYHVLAIGSPSWGETICDAPLLPDGDRNHRTVVRIEGKPSRTRFQVLERFCSCTLVEVVPETGRIHQIRAHLAYLGHPVIGDTLYGGGAGLYLSTFKKGYKGGKGKEKPLIGRVCLHAMTLEFDHPETGKRERIASPYPEDFERALKSLRKYGKSGVLSRALY
ncbi:MAG TPA: RluA family pseudouridine synthase [Spirochaetales bacterium]|nr:RluA family pseudouridine synthase [Spirochaetales bacterium]HOV37615.1 RluA family pseudouridine synthase [Spirochaetales bacterium]